MRDINLQMGGESLSFCSRTWLTHATRTQINNFIIQKQKRASRSMGIPQPTAQSPEP